ncbi:hypothetical protein [Halobaculum limi]|uniref:hypothetical protein n=1 Tax=Halobaculum limi TaxID=3031916 RepID=UPI002405121B|nr:hypothetical protein [Halobaculum sp. YSMS11]
MTHPLARYWRTVRAPLSAVVGSVAVVALAVALVGVPAWYIPAIAGMVAVLAAFAVVGLLLGAVLYGRSF